MKSGDEGREKGIGVQQRADVGKRIPTSSQRRGCLHSRLSWKQARENFHDLAASSRPCRRHRRRRRRKAQPRKAVTRLLSRDPPQWRQTSSDGADLLSFSSFTFSLLWYSSDNISISNIVDLMDLENRLEYILRASVSS